MQENRYTRIYCAKLSQRMPIGRPPGARSRLWFLTVLAAVFAMFGMERTTYAQKKDKCKHRDEFGRCQAEGIFRPPPVKSPQRIEIKSDPSGATVLLNGENQGTTPLTLRERVPSGVHRLQLRFKDYQDLESEVDFREHGTQTFSYTLSRLPILDVAVAGAVTAPEDVSLWVDSRPHGQLPTTIVLNPGMHLVEVRSPMHESFAVNIMMQVGQTYPLRPELQPRVGWLMVRSDLQELPIYVGRVAPKTQCQKGPFQRVEDPLPTAQEKGTLPSTIELIAGRYCIEVRVPKVGTYRRQIMIKPGQPSAVDIKFLSPLVQSQELPREQWTTRQNIWDKCKKQGTRLITISEELEAQVKLSERCLYLGGFYRQRGDSTRAAMLYRWSCNLGQARGCEHYGWMLRTKTYQDDVPKSRHGLLESWRTYYTKACDQGLFSACFRLYTSVGVDRVNEPMMLIHEKPRKDSVSTYGFSADLVTFDGDSDHITVGFALEPNALRGRVWRGTLGPRFRLGIGDSSIGPQVSTFTSDITPGLRYQIPIQHTKNKLSICLDGGIEVNLGRYRYPSLPQNGFFARIGAEIVFSLRLRLTGALSFELGGVMRRTIWQSFSPHVELSDDLLPGPFGFGPQIGISWYRD